MTPSAMVVQTILAISLFFLQRPAWRPPSTRWGTLVRSIVIAIFRRSRGISDLSAGNQTQRQRQLLNDAFIFPLPALCHLQMALISLPQISLNWPTTTVTIMRGR